MGNQRTSTKITSSLRAAAGTGAMPAGLEAAQQAEGLLKLLLVQKALFLGHVLEDADCPGVLPLLALPHQLHEHREVQVTAPVHVHLTPIQAALRLLAPRTRGARRPAARGGAPSAAAHGTARARVPAPARL